MMPASATARSASAITSTSGDSVRSSSSRVTSRSPAAARRTTIFAFPSAWASLARSKAWSGWPVSQSTKLVTSTTLLIGRRPMAVSRCCSHAGLGPTVTPRTTRAT